MNETDKKFLTEWMGESKGIRVRLDSFTEPNDLAQLKRVLVDNDMWMDFTEHLYYKAQEAPWKWKTLADWLTHPPYFAAEVLEFLREEEK